MQLLVFRLRRGHVVGVAQAHAVFRIAGNRDDKALFAQAQDGAVDGLQADLQRFCDVALGLGAARCAVRGDEAQDEQLRITIRDDGVGMDQAKQRAILLGSGVKGYGLKNVQERIHMFYGRRYGMTIDSQAGKGTQVSVLFPMRREC